MKICMLTTSDIDFDSRILNEAETLSKRYELTILARHYSHRPLARPQSFKIKRIKFPTFKIYQLNIFSSLFALAKAAWQEKAAIYHAHDLDGLLCAFPTALLRGKILIYDSHEVWSEIFPFSNLGLLRRFFKPLERFLMLKVKAGITVNQAIADFLASKYGKNFLALYNLPLLKKEKVARVSLKKLFPGRKIILQLGIVDEGRGLEQIMAAAKLLPKGLIIVFLGKGKLEKKIFRLIRESHLEDKVFILPRVAPEEVVSAIGDVDLGLALTQKISLSYYYSSPNKLFQYLAAEIPILGSNFPEYKKIILANRIGEVVDPAEPKLIGQKIIFMLGRKQQEKYRRNLVGLAKAKYNWSVEEGKLLSFYEENF